MEIFMFQKIKYETLNARQKECYNFQKVSAILAEYGFQTIKLSDDWQGADFIAQNFNGEQFLKIQLKGRLTFDKKYVGKQIHIAFKEKGQWYIYPHDEALDEIVSVLDFTRSRSWQEKGQYHFPYVKDEFSSLLSKYAI